MDSQNAVFVLLVNLIGGRDQQLNHLTVQDTFLVTTVSRRYIMEECPYMMC